MSSRRIFPTCPTCRRRPGFFGYAVYRCQVCGELCCESCMLKGLLAVACPHCGARSKFKKVGYTR
jgi:hypothetical protein